MISLVLSKSLRKIEKFKRFDLEFVMRSFIIIGIVVLIGLFSRNVFAFENATRTNTIDSGTLGFDPTPGIITKFMQNVGTSTNYIPDPNRSPGAFTNNPFSCISTNTDFGNGSSGCTISHGANPQTAPAFSGTNTATGHIVVNVPTNTTSTDGSLTISGFKNFDLDVANSIATTSESTIQNLNLGATIGTQNVTISNASATFATSASNTTNPPSARNIPWSLSINQTMPFPTGSAFVLQNSGIFPNAGGSFDTSAGFSGSSFLLPNQLSMPGFGFGENNFPSP